MKRLCIFVFLCLSIPSLLEAQGNHLEIGSGVELGWWVHRLGSTEPGKFSDLGIAKTHHSPSFIVEINWLWKLQKWRIGPSLQGGRFYEDDMRGPEDAPPNSSQRIRIAKRKGSVPFLRYGLQMEYALLRRGAYTFAPILRYGQFQMITTHPDRENFGYKHYYQFGVNHIWHRKKGNLFFRMVYSTQRVFLKEPIELGERLEMFMWGLGVGVQF